MVKLKYIEHDGSAHSVEVEEGMSIMEGATLNMVPGVDGMCGGICSCATCHCYLPPEAMRAVEPASSGEEAMLDFVQDRKPNSRLGCQVRVNSKLDGAEVRLPKTQGTVA
jgi:2Fe-2S ferredoxin